MAEKGDGEFDPNADPIGIGDPPIGGPGSEEVGANSALEEERRKREECVPLAEAILLRERAQEAEAKAAELAARIGELEGLLTKAREALNGIERRHRVDLALLEADAVDLEAARLLTEVALGEMSAPDEVVAVGELKRRKPFLFRSAGVGGSGAMSGRVSRAVNDGLVEAAEEAARTGDRRAVLRYLEARRREGA